MSSVDTVDYRVQVRSRGGEVELDPQVSPEEIMSREVELGLNVGLLLL